MKPFTVRRDLDQWVLVGPLFGWYWASASAEGRRLHWTKLSAWLAGWWATRDTNRQEA